jgi:hypothetical protein
MERGGSDTNPIGLAEAQTDSVQVETDEQDATEQEEKQ